MTEKLIIDENNYEKMKNEIKNLDTRISGMKSKIEELSIQKETISQECKIFEDAEQIKNACPQMDEKSHERNCIQNARKAIDLFLEQFKIKNSDHYHCGKIRGEAFINFDGQTWEMAVKTLSDSFEKTPICENCYERSTYQNSSCLKCKKVSVTTNPSKIWEIINKNSPQNSKQTV